jgi:hypothetical protein
MDPYIPSVSYLCVYSFVLGKEFGRRTLQKEGTGGLSEVLMFMV